jgi:hypothetical protein
MGSKYDPLWRAHLLGLREAIAAARTEGATQCLTVRNLEAYGARRMWAGAATVVAGELRTARGAHMRALGRLMAPESANWPGLEVRFRLRDNVTLTVCAVPYSPVLGGGRPPTGVADTEPKRLPATGGTITRVTSPSSN